MITWLIGLFEKSVDWFQLTFEIDYYKLILMAFLMGLALGLLAQGILL
jgi:hypothetical protein|tara:strand:+ start:62 stop:205 length:144 start_codon:yes stop_codon:yes gene_type:complete